MANRTPRLVRSNWPGHDNDEQAFALEYYDHGGNRCYIETSQILGICRTDVKGTNLVTIQAAGVNLYTCHDIDELGELLYPVVVEHDAMQ